METVGFAGGARFFDCRQRLSRVDVFNPVLVTRNSVLASADVVIVVEQEVGDEAGYEPGGGFEDAFESRGHGKRITLGRGARQMRTGKN